MSQTDHELVAAEPDAHVAVTQRVAEPSRDLYEQLVARRVPEHVVDALEAVEIDEQQRDPTTAAAGATERGADLLDEQRATAEAGEAIVGRVVFEALLETMLLGDVFERAEESHHRAVMSAQRNRPRAQPTRQNRRPSAGAARTRTLRSRRRRGAAPR